MRIFAAVLAILIVTPFADARLIDKSADAVCAPEPSCTIRSVVSVLPQWPADARRSEEPEGSGIVLHDGTIIATADHVLGPASKARVRTHDGQIDSAEIVLRDPETDVALLRIEGSLKPFALAEPRLRPALGARACAYGNAFGLDLSVTCGVVSAVGVTGTGFNRIEDFVQTDAAVNPGMSGGALVDEEGNLLGMLSAIFTKQSDSNIGVNFAVSTALLRTVLGDYLDNGEIDRPSPGLLIKPAGDGGGAVIVQVKEGSAEEKAGLKAGDVLRQVDYVRLTRAGVYERAVAMSRPGREVEITFQRGPETRQTRINFHQQEDQ